MFTDDDDINWEFQPRECGCPDCKSQGAYDYAHGHNHVNCIWKFPDTDRLAAKCKRCQEVKV